MMKLQSNLRHFYHVITENAPQRYRVECYAAVVCCIHESPPYLPSPPLLEFSIRNQVLRSVRTRHNAEEISERSQSGSFFNQERRYDQSVSNASPEEDATHFL